MPGLINIDIMQARFIAWFLPALSNKLGDYKKCGSNSTQEREGEIGLAQDARGESAATCFGHLQEPPSMAAAKRRSWIEN